MAFTPLKGREATSVLRGSANVSRKCLLSPCLVMKPAAVLVCLWGMARTDPGLLGTNMSRVPIFQHSLAGAGGRRIKMLNSNLLAKWAQFPTYLLPVSRAVQECDCCAVEQAGSQPKGVNHSTILLRQDLPRADRSSSMACLRSGMASSLHLPTSFRLWASAVSAMLLT